MGGRGTSQQGVPPADAKVIGEYDPATGEYRPIPDDDPQLERERDGGEKPYEVQSRGDFINGRGYALLDKTGLEWRVITRPASEMAVFAEDPADRLGMEKPTLAWSKDGKAVQIYVDGMSTEQFLDHLGLAVDLDNTTTLGKRLSRLFRPQVATGWFDADDISISYDLSQPKFQRVPDPDHPGETMVQWGTGSGDDLPAEVVEKVWDGAGVVSRDMLLKMIDQLPSDMDPKLRSKTIRELRHAKRVEFTIMTEDGQLKGHAMVSENLSTDFVVPEDLKRRVRLTDGSQRYVAFDFPHGHDHMRLDVQSLVNLHPFFEPEQLMQWVQEDFDVYQESVRTGDIAAGMAKLDNHVTIEDLQNWAIREFAASGGDINWSGSMVRSYLNAYVNRVNTINEPDGKIKLPVPGGRYYVMPSMVGRRANMPVQVARGEVTIDPKTQTAWVNDQDWIELQDATSYGDATVPMDERWGVASILGGADHDDAMWVHPFTDHDGRQKMLLWRSPNEAGERVVLKPSTQSATLPWQTVDGAVEFPQADSRKLSPRRDRVQVHDLQLIDESERINDAAGLEARMAQGEVPLFEAMQKAARREETNAALLGSVCNLQMVEKAVTGDAPRIIPAPLEQVIDLKKTGARGERVAAWAWEQRKGYLDQQTPIPVLLADRISTSAQQAARTDGTHWLDQLEAQMQDHIAHAQAVRDTMVAETAPPKALLDYAHQRPDLIQEAARINQFYANERRKRQELVRSENREMTADDWEYLRQLTSSELEKTAPEDRGRVLIGTIASVYMRDNPGNDGVAWLQGMRNETGNRDPGFAQMTIAEMRKAGVLNELIPDPRGRGLIQYQAPRRTDVRPATTVGINGVWRNVFDMISEHKDLPSYDEWDTSTKAGKSARRRQVNVAKEKVREFFHNSEALELEVRAGEWKGKARKEVYSTRTGKKVGTIATSDQAHFEVGQRIIISGSLLNNDANVRAVVVPSDHPAEPSD